MSAKPAPTDVDIHDLLAGRWSPRAYADRPVDRAQVHRLLEAARWAPSSSNLQPWRFVVFDRHRDEAAFQRAFDTLVPFNQKWNANVPLLICVTAATLSPKGEPNQAAVYDTGAAAMALTLQAHALDLAAHQMGGFDRDAFRAAFSVPDDVQIIAMISVGHHGDASLLDETLRERETAPRTRRPLGETAFEGAWGRAFG
ncbi:nitroreductase family protein [Caballeronia sp. LZ062]|uniref:nitroreductase family protein n=1 Tax=unclassified Caballeronia TaxID=2646786 RepID=UPI00285C0200|nr:MULTISPECIES: nitroreductase family protein [unclassified Caballeronia]MDR5855537.1 nitroreductase family protein [Caballeronia sp. LZ050]MDR5869937.1 nitroreductase family protein [Caballeronia sp. LZ062]